MKRAYASNTHRSSFGSREYLKYGGLEAGRGSAGKSNAKFDEEQRSAACGRRRVRTGSDIAYSCTKKGGDSVGDVACIL